MNKAILMLAAVFGLSVMAHAQNAAAPAASPAASTSPAKGKSAKSSHHGKRHHKSSKAEGAQ